MKKVLSLVIISCLISLNLSSQKLIKINLDNNNVINNITEYNVGVHLIALIEIFELKNISINLVYLPGNYQTQNRFFIHGLVKKIDNNTYSIYIQRYVSRFDIIMILCHEFVHIKQYDNGRLIQYGNKMMFDGIEYDNTYSYKNLPFEKEAFKAQGKIYKQLKEYIKLKTKHYRVFYY